MLLLWALTFMLVAQKQILKILFIKLRYFQLSNCFCFSLYLFLKNFIATKNNYVLSYSCAYLNNQKSIHKSLIHLFTNLKLKNYGRLS